jgi:hypothetical protein
MGAMIDRNNSNHQNGQRRNRLALGAAAALLAAATVFPTPGTAMPRYDGTWSVALVTTRGDCIASYRYPIQITNGVVGNGGGLAIDVRGRVAANGAVTVLVSHGDQRASGSGRLTSTVGSGFWRGAGCAGSWTAERRS